MMVYVDCVQEQPMSHIVAVDCEGRTRPVSELSSLFSSSLKAGNWLDTDLQEGCMIVLWDFFFFRLL